MLQVWSLTVAVILAIGPINSVVSQADAGYGCREADLPNEVRRDCHPEAGASEQACRLKGCVWCESEMSAGFPACFFRDPDYEPAGATCETGYVPALERVDCTSGDEPIDEMSCRYRNCTWCPSLPDANIPWCFQSAAPDSTGYDMVGQPVTSPGGVTVTISKTFQNGRPFWEGEAATLTVNFTFQSDYRLRIKITDGTPRFEVPLEIYPASGGNANPLYDVQFTPSPFSFRVIRRSSGAVLFDSAAGKLTFAEQFISLSWNLPSENVYGIGENEQRSFKHDFSTESKWPMWAADQPPYHSAALYGTQPHYTVIEEDGNVHAVAIVNSNSQEWHVIPGPMIKYITIGGLFDMYMFLGPSPDDTVAQYTEAVGRSQMPPYWGLGFQLCKYGYNTIEEMQAAVDRTEAAGIPHDVQYGDIDIMRNELDFTYATDRFEGLPEYIMELKGKGIKFVTILDPFISIIEGPDYRPFILGQEMDVWVKKADGNPVTGRVWPHQQTAPVFFPDYSKDSCKEWWRILIVEFHDLLAFDGLWIDMNEPANFVAGDLYEGCANNKWNYPPYKPGFSTQVLADKTICPDHVDTVSIHYNTHSLYGWFESGPTLTGVRDATGKRGLVLSRSTFLGSGKWTTHWLGDNWSRWSNLHFSIIGVMQFNLWGIPYVGPDMCGFIGDSNKDLCQRWMELGAFYPFARNHNGLGNVNQDPAVWGPDVAASSKAALEVRYTMLPYLYTLFYHHVMHGSTVFRPLWHNYVNDTATYSIDRQFMWGSGLLISPVLDQGALSVNAYFPDNRHFDYFEGTEISTRRGNLTLSAPMDKIPVHLAGGNVIPTQEPARNTEAARNNPMGLIVTLDDNASAVGSLFYDDGESVDTHTNGDYFYATYSMEAGTLTGSVVMDGYPDMGTKVLSTIRLLGSVRVTSVTVNGAPHASFTTRPSGEVVVTGLTLVANEEFTIVFA